MLLLLLSSMYIAHAAQFVPPLQGEVLQMNSSRVVRGIMECRCSPTFKPPSNDSLVIINATIAEIITAAAIDNTSAAATATARAALDVCVSIASIEDCINADAALRDTHTRSLCTYDKMGGVNLRRMDNVFSHVGKCRFTIPSTAAAASHVNEGCVAVEHLHGASLQYLWHLKRPVICRSSPHGVLCATPNHAIIYNGRYMSLSHLCDEQRWRGCSQRIALVNNLRASVNSRLRISSEMVITPYDVRFPKVVTWVAQLSQDALALSAGCVFASFVISVLTYYRNATNYYQPMALD